MKTKHTKGNWEYKKSELNNRDTYFIATDKENAQPSNGSLCSRRIIAFLHTEKEHMRFVEESEANAKLIAAAPEMLNILKTISEYSNATDEMPPKMIEILEDVIKKATA